MSLPLDGIKVVDLTRALSGPYCSMMLGDMGADVIKVEMPGKGDDARAWGPPFIQGESGYFLTINRNKRSITVNLKSEGGQGILRRLIKQADVLVQNFAPGVMEKLGFSYDAMREINPRIVYCAISGFGQTGPQREKLAYDLMLQGMGGLMSVTGEVGGSPVKLGVPIADILAGMFGAYATVAALYQRKETGEGQMIDANMLGGQIAILVYQAGRYLTTGEVPAANGNHHDLIAPYGTYKCGSGHFNLGVGNDTHFRKLCQAIGLPELVDDVRFRTNGDRAEHRFELQDILEERFSRYSVEELLEILDKAEVPNGPIKNIKQVFEDDQVRHMKLARTVQHPTIGELQIPGFPYELSDSPLEVRTPPPLLGQHTDQILSELGFSPDEIAGLREAKAV